MEIYIEAFQCHTAQIDAGCRSRMHHQGNINVLEASFFLHDDLTPDGFFSRRSINYDLIGLLFADVL